MAVADFQRHAAEICHCRSCRTRRMWRQGKFAGRRKVTTWREWTWEEDDVIERYAGKLTATEIAAELCRQGWERTRQAVHCRAQRLAHNLDWRRKVIHRYALKRLFAVSERRIESWEQRGALVGRRTAAAVIYEYADVERFICDYPQLYQAKYMQRGHPLTALAQVVAKRQPWLDTAEAARLLGVHPSTVRYHVVRGQIPGEKQAATGSGGWRMRLADVLAFRNGRGG